jgi:hypothetical protein
MGPAEVSSENRRSSGLLKNLLQAAQKDPEARRAWTVIVSVNVTVKTRRARTRYTNTNSSEPIERTLRRCSGQSA